jgi:hypothetical protein
VARIVLGMDPERARASWEGRLERARWLTEHGYRQLVRGDNPH